MLMEAATHPTHDHLDSTFIGLQFAGKTPKGSLSLDVGRLCPITVPKTMGKKAREGFFRAVVDAFWQVTPGLARYAKKEFDGQESVKALQELFGRNVNSKAKESEQIREAITQFDRVLSNHSECVPVFVRLCYDGNFSKRW